MELLALAHRFVTTADAGAILLSLDGISRRFGSVAALDDAQFAVRSGTVHALLGENGAGKTTLMRVAFGMLTPDEGTVRVHGEARTIASPAAAMALGIGMVHQHFTLVPAMTVAENIALGGHGRFDPTTAAARVRELAHRAGLALEPDARVQSLSVGAQQRCEIVKALARDVDVLILDEPTAVLAPPEAVALLRWMRAFADAGHAVVLITHKLREALAVADDVTVLRRGRVVMTSAASRTTEDVLRTAMVGDATDGADAPVRGDTTTGAATTRAATTSVGSSSSVVLSLQQVRYRDARGALRLRDVSLDVHAGEIVGIAAVEGSGQHELLRALAGRLQVSSGRVLRPARLGFVPEDRHRDALMLDASLVENLALRGAGERRGLVPWSALRESTVALLTQRHVRASGPQVRAGTLSGGNQQKFILGRELADAPAALVVENPSRGLDFQATTAVQTALRDARAHGAAVVVYSSDLDEVVQLADRVFVMFDGRLIETSRDREAVGRAMLGAT